MSKKVAVSVMLVLSGVLVAYAQEHEQGNPHMHGGSANSDSRHAVAFPPDMRDHTLANMRDHLQSLSAILDAMSKGQYVQASKIADARLGMESPSAEGCKNEASGKAPQMSGPSGMDSQMAKYMPDGMRKVGLRMHESASEFAVEVAKVTETGDAKPAMNALYRVTQSCTACHAAYRLK